MSDLFVKITFYITFAFLITTGTVTFIEALRTTNPFIRHALNLETCISIVASYFYSSFMEKIKINNLEKKIEGIEYKSINKIRYMDWAITTPIMLLVILIVFGFNIATSKISDPSCYLDPNNIKFMESLKEIGKYMPKGIIFGKVLIYNYLMLLFGFISETKTGKPNFFLTFFGFISFILMYSTIWTNFISPFSIMDNNIIFYIFVILWLFYGIFHLIRNEKVKNTAYNILDLFSKCFVGLFFWAYLSGSIKLLSNY